MVANNAYPTLNGITPSWADATITLAPDGAPLLESLDIKAINTNTSVEVGSQKAGGRVMKRTTGDLSNEASVTLYRGGFQRLVRGLMAVAPSRGAVKLLRFVHFNIAYQYTPQGDTEIYERRIKGCFMTGAAVNGAEGTDPSEVEVPLSVAEICDVIDGVEVSLL
jgi:hypothetical protein